MCLTHLYVCFSFTRGRFGQVHKCIENSSGLTLAAKIIKARSQKEKVQYWLANEYWIHNRIHVQQRLWDACFSRQSNGWLRSALLRTIKDYILKLDTATAQRAWACGNLSTSLCLFLLWDIWKWCERGQMSKHSSGVTLSSWYSKDSETPKSPPNTQLNPWLAHVAVSDHPWQNWLCWHSYDTIVCKY